MTIGLAVVDDDDLTREGTVAVLSRLPEIEVRWAGSHPGPAQRWDGIDVAIVDAADHRRCDDQFPGIDVIRAIRTQRGARCSVIVVTGVLFDDVVRRRAREAGADWYYHRTELVDASVLADAVLARRPRRPVPEPSDPEALFRLGVTRGTHVNAAIDAARELGLAGGDPSLARRGRQRTNRRSEFNRRAQLTPTTTGGRPPDRPQDVPSLPQIDRFLRWATTIRTR